MDKYYYITLQDICAGDILCSRFNNEDKFLVLDDTVNLTLLEINTGRYIHPTPFDLVHNFLKVLEDVPSR
jgi:hypothetical protein